MSNEQAAQDTTELRQEIDQTREQLGDTVAALADKADVKGQVSGRVEQRKRQLRDLGQRAQGALGDRQQVGKLAGTVRQRARENPPMVAGAGVIALAAIVFVRRRRR